MGVVVHIIEPTEWLVRKKQEEFFLKQLLYFETNDIITADEVKINQKITSALPELQCKLFPSEEKI